MMIAVVSFLSIPVLTSVVLLFGAVVTKDEPWNIELRNNGS